MAAAPKRGFPERSWPSEFAAIKAATSAHGVRLSPRLFEHPFPVMLECAPFAADCESIKRRERGTIIATQGRPCRSGRFKGWFGSKLKPHGSANIADLGLLRMRTGLLA
jgi:hypothetical protein